MRPVVAVVTTRASPCRCGEAWLRAVESLGIRGLDVPVEELSAHRHALRDAALVIEYADTYRSRGELRPLVRHQLASWGARLVGASAASAQLCDDKIAAREALERAGLGVAPGRVLTPAAAGGDPGATFPAVVKRAFEHGSRGVRRVDDAPGLRALARRWRGDSALLLEEFVEGRELGLVVLDPGDGPRCLPAVEVELPRGAIYDHKRKWGDRASALRAAALDAGEEAAVRDATVRAFGALGLADLARFDVRLTPRGPVFLEANARPSVEPGLALEVAASLAGLDLVQVARLILLAAARRHGEGEIPRLLA